MSILSRFSVKQALVLDKTVTLPETEIPNLHFSTRTRISAASELRQTELKRLDGSSSCTHGCHGVLPNVKI